MNPRTRRAALHAIAAVAILASLNALGHSYAGLYQWAIHHRLAGWQALTWPAEIDVFLIIGELALYVAYLDAWPARHKLWPWATALLGLLVSVAGNVGHLPSTPSHPVPALDRLTAATSPLAAFAGLAIALLVLKRTRHRPARPYAIGQHAVMQPGETARGLGTAQIRFMRSATAEPQPLTARPPQTRPKAEQDEMDIIRDAQRLLAEHRQRGQCLSQRQMARRLRAQGHTVSNARLPDISAAIGLS